MESSALERHVEWRQWSGHYRAKTRDALLSKAWSRLAVGGTKIEDLSDAPLPASYLHPLPFGAFFKKVSFSAAPCTTICLPEIINKLRRTNRNRRIILHHDTPAVTYVKPLIFYPVIMSNWWLIVRIHLIYHLMTSFCSQTLKIRCVVMIPEITALEWKKCFGNWFERMQKCIDLNSEYFEKQ